MKQFKCTVAQNGFFAGPAFFIRQAENNDSEKSSGTEKEIKRLQEAVHAMKTSVLSRIASDANREIQQTVLSLLSDEAFIGRAEKKISEQFQDAASAVRESANELTAAMERVNSEYIRSRRDDIRGVADRLIFHLNGGEVEPRECSAVCAEVLSPALLSSFDEELIGALLTDKGSSNSHASILAGNMEIPYLYGNREAVLAAEQAEYVIIDSERAIVITDPDEKNRKEAAARMAKLTEERKNRKALQNDSYVPPPCRTKIYANIEGPQDIDVLLRSGADGVGLFRSEFLFLGKDRMPTEEEQFEAYRKVLDAMGDKEVIIRTMDIGSDKKVSWLKLPEESNPALGLRGVRVSLEREAFFHTQLRALLRAGTTGNLKVMFPMITSSWEIEEIKERVRQSAEELKREGIEYRIPELGIMVETPAAAVCAAEMAEKVSFFSIGTNDLTQYTLALDRESQGLDRYFSPHHEAVFRLIEMTAKGGHSHGITTGVCGQLAADPEAVKRLIQAGADELSVAVKKVKSVRRLAAQAEKEIDEDLKNGRNAETVSVTVPADGELIPMSEIPDPVFSGGTLGECFGIMPENGKIYSPVTGTVRSVAETGHAVTIRSADNRDYLVHAGINTVQLGKKAFVQHVALGEHVENGQLIMEADLDMIRNAGLSPMIIVAALS